MKLDQPIFMLLLTIVVIVCCYSSVAHGADVLQQCAEANLRKLNEYRRSRGLGRLTMNSEARRRAEGHSKKMASSDHLYHSDWSVFMDYENVAQNWMTTGEGLDKVGAKLFQQWKESPGHNKNMLRGDTKYAGIACVAMSGDYMQKIYATQIFWRSAYGGHAEQPGGYPPNGGQKQTRDKKRASVVDKGNGSDDGGSDEDGKGKGDRKMKPQQTKKPKMKKYRYRKGRGKKYAKRKRDSDRKKRKGGNRGRKQRGKKYHTRKPDSHKKKKKGGNRRRKHHLPNPSEEPKVDANAFHDWFWHNWWYHDGSDNTHYKYDDKENKDAGNQWYFSWFK